ncbi:hypothetical protein JYT36_01010, partial [Bacteroidales bacterium AH-315-N07]|nr:hypothetical protein [Bacteroidales bacterium AH-315-N07]
TVTDANGCMDTTSQLVIVNGQPTAAITGTTVICIGSSASLNASGGISYSWDNASTSASITVSPTANTTYTVTVTDASGCIDTASQQVTVNGQPTAAIAGAFTICSGTSTTLTGTGGVSYTWDDGSTTGSITVSPTTNTTYTVTVIDGNGCKDTASQLVTVGGNPVAGITGTTAICIGSSASITATGGTTYEWNTGATTESLTVSITSSTTYTVTVSLGIGCKDTTSQLVTVNAQPTAAITGTTLICVGSSATLNASGGASYSWDDASTTSSITVSPTANTTYTVTVTDANGCIDTASQQVTVNAQPTAAITGTTVICVGSSASLNVSGGTSYSWDDGSTSASISVSPTANTTYTVTVTDANGCIDTSSEQVTVNVQPTAAITGTTVICIGSLSTLTASGGTDYSWNTVATSVSINVSPISTSTYTLTITDVNGCKDTASATVTVNSQPTAATSGTTVICIGSSATLNASGGISYNWSSGNTTSSIIESPSTTTSYTVTVTDGNGCKDTSSIAVAVNGQPAAGISGSMTICNGTSTDLTGAGGTSYLWDNGLTTTTITVSPTTDATYTITVTDLNGCKDTTSTMVTVENCICPIQASFTYSGDSCLSLNSFDFTNTGSTGGGKTYSWTFTGGTPPTSTLENPAGISWSSASSYTVRFIIDSTGVCADTVTMNINVYSNPTAGVSLPTVICIGSNATVTGSGGSSYTWNNGNTSSNITV